MARKYRVEKKMKTRVLPAGFPRAVLTVDLWFSLYIALRSIFTNKHPTSLKRPYTLNNYPLLLPPNHKRSLRCERCRAVFPHKHPQLRLGESQDSVRNATTEIKSSAQVVCSHGTPLVFFGETSQANTPHTTLLSCDPPNFPPAEVETRVLLDRL